VAGLEQPRDALEKISDAKIVKAAAPLRPFDQINCTKWGRRNAGFLQ
jgi:hypothetical protein